MFNVITVCGEETTEQLNCDSDYMLDDKVVSDSENKEIISGELNSVDDTTANDTEVENQEELDKNAPSDEIEEVKHYGWYYNERDKGWYYYNPQGEKLYGWQHIAGKWYYLDSDNKEYPGLMLSECVKELGDLSLIHI